MSQFELGRVRNITRQRRSASRPAKVPRSSRRRAISRFAFRARGLFMIAPALAKSSRRRFDPKLANRQQLSIVSASCCPDDSRHKLKGKPVNSADAIGPANEIIICFAHISFMRGLPFLFENRKRSLCRASFSVIPVAPTSGLPSLDCSHFRKRKSCCFMTCTLYKRTPTHHEATACPAS